MKLLPCPFCGQSAKLSKLSGNWNACCISGDDVDGKMEPCGIVLFGNWDESKESVGARWNRRKPLPPPPSADAPVETEGGVDKEMLDWLEAASREHRGHTISTLAPGEWPYWYYSVPGGGGKTLREAILAAMADGKGEGSDNG